jgi:hypothetical protein
MLPFPAKFVLHVLSISYSFGPNTLFSTMGAPRCADKGTTLHELNSPWPESASELYRPSDCLLSAKLVPNFCG